MRLLDIVPAHQSAKLNTSAMHVATSAKNASRAGFAHVNRCLQVDTDVLLKLSEHTASRQYAFATAQN